MGATIISDTEVIRLVLDNAGSYAVWLGAGASREAGMDTADEICKTIRSDLEKNLPRSVREDAGKLTRWATNNLKWEDLSRRYTTCIRVGRPSLPIRVRFFRDLLNQHSRPAFCQHATALLMQAGLIQRTCLTTNFDHLL